MAYHPLTNDTGGTAEDRRAEADRILKILNLTDWRKRNPEKNKARQGRSYHKVKDIVFTHYGKRCACCGETEPLFLTIDHVNNDGGGREREMRGYAMYNAIIAAGFPASFQVLCWNCNSGRARNGGICPHLKDKL